MNYAQELKLRDLKRTVPKALSIINEYRASVQAINKRWDLDSETKRRGRELARRQALDRMAELKAQTKRLSEELMAEFDALAHKPPKIGQAEAVHAEGLRGRLRKAESLNGTALEIAREAASRNDLSRLNALRVILPDLAAEKGVAVDPELDEFLRFTTADIDSREAMAALGELTKGVYRLNVTLGLAEYDLQNGNFDRPDYSTVWPEWSPDREIEV